MDKNLLLLLHLYDEADDSAGLEKLLQDEALRAEYEVLREAKDAIAANRSLRSARMQPDPGVVSDVIRAGMAQRRPRLTLLRFGLTRARSVTPRVRRIAGWSSLAMAAVVAGILVWSQGGAQDPVQQAATEPGTVQSAAPTRDLLRWDDTEPLVNVHSHIEVLQARSALDQWDKPELLSLDSLPADWASPGRFTPASTRR